MTARTSSKRTQTASTEGSQSASDSSGSSRGDEKTIPFLRRLTDMLIENEEYISFTPGLARENGQVVLGKIVVHDRVKVESSILPRYFNHSSFASLRRQLNYFSFTRIGKGRQRGATYCNDAVVVLDDILTLTRRSVTHNSSGDNTSKTVGSKQSMVVTSPPTTLKQAIRESAIPKSVVRPNKRIRINESDGEDRGKPIVHQTPLATTTNHGLPARVSPVDSLVGKQQQPAPKRISLDLTGVSSVYPSPEPILKPMESVTIVPNDDSASMDFALFRGGEDDKDILAGCRALLCFSRGIPSN